MLYTEDELEKGMDLNMILLIALDLLFCSQIEWGSISNNMWLIVSRFGIGHLYRTFRPRSDIWDSGNSGLGYRTRSFCNPGIIAVLDILDHR